MKRRHLERRESPVAQAGSTPEWDEYMNWRRTATSVQPWDIWSASAARTRVVLAATATAAAPGLPPLNEQLIEILGRPNFMCIRLAEVLRTGGHVIKSKAEHEQAAALHFLLTHYLRHGDKWVETANADLGEMLKASRAKAAGAEA